MKKFHIDPKAIILTAALTVAVGLAAGYVYGVLLAGGKKEKVVTEPNALYYPLDVTGTARNGAAAAAESGAEAAAGAKTALSEPKQTGSDPAAALSPDDLSNKSVGWGQGVEVNDKNQPTGALQGQEKYGALGGYFIFPDVGNTVYLTYDLGYENGHTGAILDALKEKGVHGVFFVTMDYVKSAPDIVRRIIDEGHILGNHSVSHPSMPSCSDEQVNREVMELHDYIQQNFGYTMTLFRFPRGEFSERTMAEVKALGYTSVFWSYAYVDWKTDSQPDVAASLQKLTKAAHPGAIYLLHTVSTTNAALMGDLIDNLKAAGYTVGEMPH